MPNDGYVLARFKGEIERLGFQYRIWAESAHALWRRGGLAAGAHVLDAGCGPGFGTLELAEWVGADGQVTAFDRTAEYLQHLQQQLTNHNLNNVTIKQGTLDNLDLAAATFDFIFTKLVLIYVQDLDKVLQEFARVLKPGGKLLVSDLCNFWKISPPSPAIDKCIAVSKQHFHDNGANLEVGRVLPATIARNGFTLASLTPETKMETTDSDLWRAMRMFYHNAMPLYVDEGVLQQEDVDRFYQELSQLEATAGTFIAAYPFMHIVAVKPH